jgi:hypothetical protein
MEWSQIDTLRDQKGKIEFLDQRKTNKQTNKDEFLAV